MPVCEKRSAAGQVLLAGLGMQEKRRGCRELLCESKCGVLESTGEVGLRPEQCPGF